MSSVQFVQRCGEGWRDPLISSQFGENPRYIGNKSDFIDAPLVYEGDQLLNQHNGDPYQAVSGPGHQGLPPPDSAHQPH